MTSAINDLLIRRGLITPTYEPRKITNEDKQIEKLAKAIGKEFSKEFAKFKVNEANNAFLAEVRAYESY